MNAGDPLGQVEHAQDLFLRSPLAAVAAFFAVAFFVALWLLLRSQNNHRRELTQLYAQELVRAQRLETVLGKHLEMLAPLQSVVEELTRRRRGRRALGDSGGAHGGGSGQPPEEH